MSAPITAARFAAALADLPLSSLHAKGAEIRNSMAHLRSSNEQLRPLADGGDADCADAMRENVEVMARMEERLGLLRKEVQRRGSVWDDAGGGGGGAAGEGDERDEGKRMVDGENGSGERARTMGGGRPGSSDDETARSPSERMREDEGDEDDGLHL